MLDELVLLRAPFIPRLHINARNSLGSNMLFFEKVSCECRTSTVCIIFYPCPPLRYHFQVNNSYTMAPPTAKVKPVR